jgi:hypothetical protein
MCALAASLGADTSMEKEGSMTIKRLLLVLAMVASLARVGGPGGGAR